MYLNILFGILLQQKQNYFTSDFDPISELRDFVASPLLSDCVEKMLHENILTDIDKIHKEHVYVRVEIADESISIYKDEEVILENSLIFLYPDSPKFLHEKTIQSLVAEYIKEYIIDHNVILNFPTVESATRFTKSYLDEVIVSIIKSVCGEITVVEVDEEDKSRVREKAYLGQIFQYFYEKDDKYYCAYLKSYQPNGLNTLSDIPALEYFVKRFSNEINENSFEPREKLKDKDGKVFTDDKYLQYIVSKIIESYGSELFFEKFFTRIGYNNFFRSYIFLFNISDEFFNLCKEYCAGFSAHEKPFFYKFNLRKYYSSFTMKTPDGEEEIADLIEIPQVYKTTQEINPYVKELHTFFCYLFENHKDLFIQHKTKLLEIMEGKIAYELKSLSGAFTRIIKHILHPLDF